MPRGYLETLKTGQNLLADPEVAALWAMRDEMQRLEAAWKSATEERASAAEAAELEAPVSACASSASLRFAVFTSSVLVNTVSFLGRVISIFCTFKV